jgi:hypothetical protein
VIKINENYQYLGPVAYQVHSRHSCNKVKTWEKHMESPVVSYVDDEKGRGKLGMNPILKADDPFRLPKPNAMFNRLLEKLGDEDITNLFPTNCLPEVKNHITGYFRHKFGLKLPPGYLVPPTSDLATLVSQSLLRRFANQIMVEGKNVPLRNQQVAKDSVQAPEHLLSMIRL